MCRASGSARTGNARMQASVVLVVLATAGTAWMPAGQSPLPIAPTQELVAPRAVQDTGRRPFQHNIHDALPCRGCHGSGATHRVTLVRTARDCAACHHDPQRGLACTKCHSSGSLGGERPVSLSLNLKVADTPRRRGVAFRHAPHVTDSAGITCRDCHATEITLARNRECGSCHESHHGGKAECTACHAAPRQGAHDASVHLTCTSGSCHAAARAPSPTLSRTTCVFCHTDRRDHEPDGSCAACHRIPRAAAVPGGRHASPGLRPR